MNSLLKTLDEEAGDGELLLVQPGGNHGDSLIYLGMEKRLREAGIPSTQFGKGAIRNDSPRETGWFDPRIVLGLWSRVPYLKHRLATDVGMIYIHGGGNFSEVPARTDRSMMWDGGGVRFGGGIRCYKTITRFFDCPIVVGPQSVAFEESDPERLFEDISNETHFFCREEYSYDIMREATSSAPNVTVSQCNDTALFLEPADLPVSELTEEYTLLAFREDSESVVPRIEDGLETPVVSRDISGGTSDLGMFVGMAARAGKIHTDRLHVAILGTILDKEVIFYDNAYHKNRGVYEYSFADNPDVEFKYLW